LEIENRFANCAVEEMRRWGVCLADWQCIGFALNNRTTRFCCFLAIKLSKYAGIRVASLSAKCYSQSESHHLGFIQISAIYQIAFAQKLHNNLVSMLAESRGFLDFDGSFRGCWRNRFCGWLCTPYVCVC